MGTCERSEHVTEGDRQPHPRAEHRERDRGLSPWDKPRARCPPNGWPVCLRIGYIGSALGQAWAVGTTGLLDTIVPANEIGVLTPRLFRGQKGLLPRPRRRLVGNIPRLHARRLH